MTPADFSVMVTGLPICTADEFKEHLEKKTLDGIDVEYVNPAYKIDDYVRYQKAELWLTAMLYYYRDYRENKLKELGISEQEAE